MADILVVDDDQSIATAFRVFLEDDRHTVRVASNATDGLRLIVERCPDLVIMDVRMPGIDGLEALREIRSRFPDLFVVMMTAYGTSQTSIEAIRAGAFDYLTKPLDLDDLRAVIAKALGTLEIRRSSPGSDDDGDRPEALVNLVGQSQVMLEVYKLIARLTTNDVPAVIVGERGTGKQLVAATIHDNSQRRDGPFASIDCRTRLGTSIPELFDEGAGTILLANVDALDPALQTELARAFEETARPAGGRRLSARVLVSTEQDLSEAVREGRFNRELLDTLSVITIRLPPLRERRGDIPGIVAHLIRRFNAELNRSIKGVDASVMQLLSEHPWPGNVRELEGVIKRACILARADVIVVDDLGPGLVAERQPARGEADAALRAAVAASLQERLLASQQDPSASAFHDIVEVVEEALIQGALTITNGNQVKASEILKVNRATLRKKMSEQS